MSLIKLSNTNEFIEIPFNTEQPFVVITGVKFNFEREKIKDKTLTIYFDTEHLNGKRETYPITTSKEINTAEQYTINNKEFTLNGVKNAFLYCKTSDDIEINNLDIELKYEVIRKLDISFPENEFDKHINDKRNTKILFSAPYGQGKSTFLDYYFESREKDFRVFKIFPVNYSVSSNEDIFKYIKFEILSQLLELPDNFYKESPQYKQSLKEFTGNNIDKILAPLFLAIPKIGKDLYSIYEKYDKLKNEYFEYHESLKVDDKSKVLEFIQKVYETEGSIYEDNFFTKVIKQILEKLTVKNPEIENVLVIEDLDRLDPEHIFRILNVLSAHFDSKLLNGVTEKNKFGFDRVILVCDIDNVKHVFEHRYGRKVDFGGYINKFYSTGVFPFNNKKVVENIIRNFDNLRDGHHDLSNKTYIYLSYFLRSQFYTDNVNLRDLFKLKTTSLKSMIDKIKSSRRDIPYWFRYSPFTPILMLLEKTGSIEIIKSNIEDLKSEYFIMSEIHTMCLELIVSLDKRFNSEIIEYYNHIEDNIIEIKVKNNSKDDTIQIVSFQYLHAKSKHLLSDVSHLFTFEDFKSFLIENLDRYNSIKQLI